MCGIAGVVGPRAERATERVLVEALDLMQHRGPDASGQWKGRDVWLGHRRLAIIDLSPRGNQPMSSPDGRYVCILNGEIYNFRDIRSRLESLGVRFLGGSDTEVLLHAYARWGVRVLESLDGMFAFAIWDDRSSSCSLRATASARSRSTTRTRPMASHSRRTPRRCARSRARRFGSTSVRSSATWSTATRSTREQSFPT